MPDEQTNTPTAATPPPMVAVPQKRASSSILVWVGVLTMMGSILTDLTQSGMIPTQYVTYIGFAIGLITTLRKVMGDQAAVTVFGRSMASTSPPEVTK